MTDFDITVPQYTDLLAQSEDLEDTALPSGSDPEPASSPLSPAPHNPLPHLIGGGCVALVLLVALVWVVFPGDQEQLRRVNNQLRSLTTENAALAERVRVLEASERTQSRQLETLAQDKQRLLRSMQEAHHALDGYRPAYEHLNE